MKCLIVLCALVAVSVARPGYLHGGLAGLAGVVAPGYAGPIAIPAINAAGVPVDTPEVQAARAAHAAAHASAGAAALIAGPGIAVAAAPAVYAGPQHLPVIDASGVPVDTPDVQAARAAHAVAQGVSAAAAASGAPAGVIAAPGIAGLALAAPSVYAGPQHIPVLTASGVPVDTPEVQAARAADAAAHLAAKGLIG